MLNPEWDMLYMTNMLILGLIPERVGKGYKHDWWVYHFHVDEDLYSKGFVWKCYLQILQDTSDYQIAVDCMDLYDWFDQPYDQDVIWNTVCKAIVKWHSEGSSIVTTGMSVLYDIDVARADLFLSWLKDQLTPSRVGSILKSCAGRRSDIIKRKLAQ